MARVSGSTGALSCHFTAADGTALAGTDYVPTNGVLAWADGDTSTQSITVALINDSAPRGSRTFRVSLSSEAVSVSSSTEISILEDDPLSVPRMHPSLQGGLFKFTVSGSSNWVIVTEACTNLTTLSWIPVQTNTLTGGSTSFVEGLFISPAVLLRRL